MCKLQSQPKGSVQNSLQWEEFETLINQFWHWTGEQEYRNFNQIKDLQRKPIGKGYRNSFETQNTEKTAKENGKQNKLEQRKLM